MAKPCYLFDIDGTLADITHRLHHIQDQPKNWEAFFAACSRDEPIPHICSLARTLSAYAPIVLVSGRSDKVRTETDYWIKVSAQLFAAALYMRKDGDHRPDHEVKGELLDQLMDDGWKPTLCFILKNGQNRAIFQYDAGVPDHPSELPDRPSIGGAEAHWASQQLVGPIMAFDDRTQVVKMWRKRGVPCAQVAEGDF